LILVIVPIKSADKFKYRQNKGTLFLAKRPLLKNSPLGCFVNSPLVNALLRQGVSLTAVSDQRVLPSGHLPLLKKWTKLLDLKIFFLMDFFDKLNGADFSSAFFIAHHFTNQENYVIINIV